MATQRSTEVAAAAADLIAEAERRAAAREAGTDPDVGDDGTLTATPTELAARVRRH